jgi:GxxExxY protein
MEVHSILGAGLLESAYEEALCHELSLRGIPFQRQASFPVLYKGVKLDCGFRADILIPGRLIVEIKSVERLLPVHQAQLITYLRLSEIFTGLLINFNVAHLRQGLRRLKANMTFPGRVLPSSPPFLPVKQSAGDGDDSV